MATLSKLKAVILIFSLTELFLVLQDNISKMAELNEDDQNATCN